LIVNQIELTVYHLMITFQINQTTFTDSHLFCDLQLFIIVKLSGHQHCFF